MELNALINDPITGPVNRLKILDADRLLKQRKVIPLRERKLDKLGRDQLRNLNEVQGILGHMESALYKGDMKRQVLKYRNFELSGGLGPSGDDHAALTSRRCED